MIPGWGRVLKGNVGGISLGNRIGMQIMGEKTKTPELSSSRKTLQEYGVD
jgi:hypothetical protein